MTDLDLDSLEEELKDFAEPDKKGGRSAREERIIAGFEDIQKFVDEHGRLPSSRMPIIPSTLKRLMPSFGNTIIMGRTRPVDYIGLHLKRMRT